MFWDKICKFENKGRSIYSVLVCDFLTWCLVNLERKKQQQKNNILLCGQNVIAHINENIYPNNLLFFSCHTTENHVWFLNEF